MKFYTVATDTENGEPVYRQLDKGVGEDLQWYRASASMPMVSRPVIIDGKTYLDGGISDSIPLEFMQRQGYEKNLVVLTQPLGYKKKQPAIMPLFRLSLRKHPKMIEAMKNRHIMYNRETEYVAEQVKLGNTFVIRPPKKLDIGKIEHDPEKMQKAYEIRKNTMQKHLSELKRFLEE